MHRHNVTSFALWAVALVAGWAGLSGCSQEKSCPPGEEKNPITYECRPIQSGDDTGGETVDDAGGDGSDDPGGSGTGGAASGGGATGVGGSSGGTDGDASDGGSLRDGGDGGTSCDRDGDGAEAERCGGEDCNDSNPRVRPGMEELCDELDNDCDGQVNEEVDCSFFAHDRSRLYKIDPFEESMTEVEAKNSPVSNFLDIDTDPDGRLWTVTREGLYRLPAEGERWERVSTLSSVEFSVNGMAIDRRGVAFLTGVQRLYRLDLEDAASGGQPQVVGSTGSYSSSGDCVVDKKERLLMTSVPPDGEAGPDLLVELDSSDASTEEVGPTSHEDVWGLTAAWSTLYGVTETGELIEIDPETGASESVHTFSDVSFYGAASTPASRRSDGT